MTARDTAPTATGRCLCGAVRYRIYGPIRPVIECHCESCRRFSGGLWHGSAARTADIDITDDDGALGWYRSSPEAERGFCRSCGSSLFFRRDNGERVSFSGGSLDRPSGVRLSARIFTGETADYAAGAGELPTFEGWAPAEYFAVPDR